MSKIIFTKLSLILFSCSFIEDISEPRAPVITIDWLIGSNDDGKGQLLENFESGLPIGILNATDPNPDDEVSYRLDKQTIDGQDVNFFEIQLDDSLAIKGITYLKTKNSNLRSIPARRAK